MVPAFPFLFLRHDSHGRMGEGQKLFTPGYIGLTAGHNLWLFFAMTLAEYIEKHPGVTQASLAKEIGVSQVFVSLLVKGTRKPSLPVAVKLEHATGGEITAKSWTVAA